MNAATAEPNVVALSRQPRRSSSWLDELKNAPLTHAEDLLLRLRGRIALVGNATPRRPFGTLIDRYDAVIRFNNFRLDGFAELVGTRTDLRCTTGWHDIEHRAGLLEFTPFTAGSRESANLAAFNAVNHRPVLAARTDIHPLAPETPNPSTGLALVQLLQHLGIEADLFGFDGFQTGHYWNGGAPMHTSHSRREMDIVLSRPHVVLLGETYPYAELYEFCHQHHPEYDDNVGVELFRRLNKTVRGKKILEFGAGNGGLSAQLERWGNEVTAFEIASNAFAKIQCTRKVPDSALGLPFLKEHFDLFVSVDVLEHLTENDIRLVLREAARTCGEIFLAVSTRPSGLLGPRGENLHLTVRPAEWWEQQVGRWFDVRSRPGYGQGQLVLEGPLRRRSALAYEIQSEDAVQRVAGHPLALPAAYQSRAEPQYFEDSVTESTGIIWQPEVYPFAGWLARELGCHRLVDVGCGRAGKLAALAGEFAITGLDYGSNLAYCRTHHPAGSWLEVDLEQAAPWPLPADELSGAVLICADVIEHLREPRRLLRNLRRCLEQAPALVLSTPERVLTRGARHPGPPDNPAHTREWALEELVALLQSEGLSVDYAGLTPGNDREPERRTILCVVSRGDDHAAMRWAERRRLAPEAHAPFEYRQALRARNGDGRFVAPAVKSRERCEARDVEAALAECRSARAKDPDNAALGVQAGEWELRAGRPLEALGTFQELLAEGKEETGVFWGMARSCAALGDLAAARMGCECVLALEPENADALRLLRRLNGETTRGREPGWSFCLITNGRRPEKLHAEIASIRALNMPRCEILVGGEPPPGLDADIRVVPAVDAARDGRLGEMRNRLVEAARYDHLVVADDDLLFHEDFFRGIQAFGPDWDVMCVRLLNPDGTRFWDWATHGGPRGHRLLDYTETDPHLYVTGGLCIMKAHVAGRVAWDDGRGFYQGEDLDFSARLRAAGIVPRFNPHSSVTHDDPRYTRRGHVVARDALEVKRPVRWCGPIFNPSGYASEAINFVVPLKDRLELGIHHHNNLYSEKFANGLADAERAALYALRDRFARIKGGIVISHNPANGFLRLTDGEYHIGRTMFETDRIPPDWVQACNRMDEVWVPSRFNAATFAAAGVEPDKLVVMPGAVDEHFFDPKRHRPMAPPRPAAFNFLSIFEWSSRKGWDVLLAAYLREFGADDDVCLYLRAYLFSKPDEDPRTVIERRIREYAAGLGLKDKRLPRIEILAEQVPLAELPALYLAADCLVAPSRGEGWGRPQHEAMLMERPVIATNWSANPEFMRPDNSYLLDYELVEARRLEPEMWRYRGHRWADPSEAHLRRLLRHVQQHPDEAQAKGRAARLHMARHFGREAVAIKVLRRLNEIEHKLSSPYVPAVVARQSSQPPAPAIGPKQIPLVAWEGSFLDHGSLSRVNRELTAHLANSRALKLQRVGRNPVKAHESALRQLARQLLAVVPRNAGITVRHAWPPNFTRAHGALVLLQPWEYGTLPAEWVNAVEQADEVWAYSNYVRRVYVDSGVSPAKVKIVPLGIDPEKFRPDAPPRPLNTSKRFKFLFVGGTIHRKGPDVLLQAYLSSFGATDDVCLVIKDFGGQSVYAGQTLGEQIRAAQAQPGAPEILYLDEELADADLPGLYAACDCLVHPYRGEGFGLPVLEAMACGLPVVVTAGGATDDFATEDLVYRLPAMRVGLGREVGGMKLAHTGWWLEPDGAELKRLMHAVFNDPVAARERGRRASETVRREWTWARSAAVAEQRLNELAAKCERAREEKAARRARKAPAIQLPEAARLGDLRGAREALVRREYPQAWQRAVEAMRERPFHPEAWLLLAEIAGAMNNPAQSRYCGEQAKKLAPRWKDAQRKLASLNGRNAPSAVADLPLPLPSGPRVSVCLIVKNEERFLRQCLESVRELAWQIVVVDTGSTDNTVEIAREFGAEVHSMAWEDDFSAARNAALSHARGDWILVLDADEELLPESREILRRELRQADALAFRLPIVDVGREDDGCSYIPRLFRNAPGLFYVSRVHEQVFSSVEVRRRQWGMENKLSEAVIRHHGYVEQVVKSRDKVARNLRLLEQAVEEWPNEPNLLMSLGLELARAGQLGAALEYYVEAFELLGARPAAEVAPELRETLLTQFTTQLMAVRRFEELVQVLNSPLALSQSGLTATHHFTLGLACMELKQPAHAVEAFRRCLATRQQRSLAPINKEVHKAGPRHCLAVCLADLGRIDEARQEFAGARLEDPQSCSVLFDFARFEAQHGRPVESLRLLHALIELEPGREAAWLFGGQIALSRPDYYEFAADWTAEAVRHHPANAALARQRAEALLLNQDAPAALDWWRRPQVVAKAHDRAALLWCELGAGQPLTPLAPGQETVVSRELLNWYRRLVEANAARLVEQIHGRLPDLGRVAPSAAGALEEVLRVAELP
ncbi:MAG: glycosyltransferase family 29 protein [Verrucomicrobiota bacterium]